MRRVEFQIGEYYHIFNRGVEKREVFCDLHDFGRFIRGMREFNRVEVIGGLFEKERRDIKLNLDKNVMSVRRPGLQRETWSQDDEKVVDAPVSKLVKIVCYCLIPNHFHFLLQPLVEKGVEKFLHKSCLGYASYFNNEYKRSGSLFQGPYKSIHIKTNENLLRLSSYINGNSEVHGICQAEKWRWGSYQDYLNIRQGDMCNKEDVLGQFKNIEEYFEFSDYIIKESKETKLELKKYYLE